ncbi:MAG: dihydroorotase family protein [Trueperaceae bacterium]|nr:dihydroorotase family protein [Trueperaceae bacterium]
MPVDRVIIGDLVLPHGVERNGALSIDGGRIVGIHPSGGAPEALETLDYQGKLVLPGGIDTHVHAYSGSEQQEGLERLTRGAARGGLTTVLDMPYDRPDAITDTERFQAKVEVVGREAVVDVGLYATLTKFGGAPSVASLAQAGACAFKLSTYETDPNRFPEIPDSELVRIFPEIAETGSLVAFHAENGAIIDPLVKAYREAGTVNPEAHCWSRPPESEGTAVAKLLELARAHPVRLHVVHLTVPFVYDLIGAYQDAGVDVTAETCLHYLILAQEQMDSLGGFGKMNPPLRPAEMRDDLWGRLEAGQIAFVTSDHAPWPASVKTKPVIFDNASGLPGVETLLPLLYSEAVAGRDLDVVRFAELIATNPAERFGLYPRKGALIPGGDADVCVLDPTARWRFDAARTESIARWSPFDGTDVTGKVVRTLVRGADVFRDDEVVGAPGSGRFVRP